MDRRPRTEEQIYAWHRETLAYIAVNGEAARGRPPIHENEPECGWFRRRTEARGPFVPARIWIEPPETDHETGEQVAPERMLCEVDGKRADVFRAWTWLARHPISEDQYFEMKAGGFRGLAPEPENPCETAVTNGAPVGGGAAGFGGGSESASAPEPGPAANGKTMF